MGKVRLSGYKCERCGHKWFPRKNSKPRVCPKCKNAYWDVPKKKRTIARRQKTVAEKKISNSKTRG